MTTRDGVGFHKNGLAEFDAVCFFCLLHYCNDADPLCLHRMLERLRAIERQAGGEPARVLEMLQRRKGA